MGGPPSLGRMPGGTPSDHPLVAAAQAVAAEVLAPAATAVDEMPLLPRSHLDAMAAAGLMGLTGPVDQGGSDAAGPVVRLVQRIVAGACGATYFTWVQHQAPVRYLAPAPDSPARRRWLGALCRGAAWGGVAFAYLRRPGPPAVRASPDGEGWVLDGAAPWVTGWGLIDVLVVVAAAPDGRKVFAALSPQTDGLVASTLDLMVLGSTGTVRLAFEGVRVGTDELIDVWPAPRWDRLDGEAAARPNGAPFGIADAAIAGLAEKDGRRAAGLAAALAACTARSEALLEGPVADREQWLGELTAVRDRSIDLANRAAQAWVAASGGRAMERCHPAQRLLREAAFYLVQAQTPALRSMSLDRLTTN
ncbi:MAG: hypothetical protein NVS1B12_02010 [Acidimicrobiales bacterium]